MFLLKLKNRSNGRWKSCSLFYRARSFFVINSFLEDFDKTLYDCKVYDLSKHLKILQTCKNSILLKFGMTSCVKICNFYGDKFKKYLIRIFIDSRYKSIINTNRKVLATCLMAECHLIISGPCDCKAESLLPTYQINII